MKLCKQCKELFPSSIVIEGKRRSLTQRSYCLNCTPYGKRPIKYKGRYRATDEEVKIAVENSKSYAEVLRKLNLTIFGSAYQTIKTRIQSLNLKTEHFVGISHLKNKNHNWATKIPLEDLLVIGSKISSNSLKKRLLKEKLLSYKCNKCSIEDWLGEKLSLQLDHINGNNIDNRLENLRLLCPNCHSQTSTFCRKKDAMLELADDTE